MRLKLMINGGDGFDSVREVEIDQSGMLREVGEAPLKASERMDLGDLVACVDEKAMSGACKVSRDLDEIVADMRNVERVRRKMVDDWADQIEKLVEQLQEHLAKIEGEGQKIGGHLEVMT